jgi:hypothetical protein
VAGAIPPSTVLVSVKGWIGLRTNSVVELETGSSPPVRSFYPDAKLLIVRLDEMTVNLSPCSSSHAQ